MTHRVVLVDDVAEIRQILRLILEHAGPFEVVGEGANGHDAVRLAADLRPDLLVMDVEMRGGPSGWEVLPEIRDASPATAVVILSGSAVDPMHGERVSMADGVLEKGLPPQELNDALLAILGNPHRSGSGAVVASAPASATPNPTLVPSSDRAIDPAAILAAVVDLTGDAVVELTPAGAVRAWNRGAERLFGRGASEVLGVPFASISTERSRPDVEQLVRRAAAGERIDGVTVAHAAAGGDERHVTMSIAPLPAGMVVVARDAAPTERSDQAMAWAVAELESKRREADRARRELEGFASVASHDIAQPLQVAYGYLEMVRSEFAEGMDETAVVWIDAAVGSLERMRLLVQDILAYARGGNREVQPTAVSIEEAARAALAGVEELVTAREAEVRLRSPLPTVAAGDEQVVTILEQLLDNAVRYAPDGRVPVVEVHAAERDDEWVVSVTDNGPGIPHGQAERVFDVFFRGAKATTSGTGLGLSLSRKLVERMGGRIWAEPRADGAEGACVRFALPKDLT